MRSAFLSTCLVCALSLASVQHAAAQGYTLNGDQRHGLEREALGLAAFTASKDECYYDPKIGPVLQQIDELRTRQFGDTWVDLRTSAPDSLPALTNMAQIMGAKSKCSTLGLAVGDALYSALSIGKLDATTLPEIQRLSKGGGRSLNPEPDTLPATDPSCDPNLAAGMMRKYRKETGQPQIGPDCPGDVHSEAQPQPAPAVASALATPTVRPPSMSEQRPDRSMSQCLLEVKGHLYILGPCRIDKDAEGSLSLENGSKEKPEYLAYVEPQSDGSAMAYWNETRGSGHAQSELGELKQYGACWISDIAKVCAWE